MLSQLQLLNKVLDDKDYSIISLNNLTEDYFFNYRNEFNFIKNHFNAYQAVPDKLTFVNNFPDFDLQTVTEPTNFLIANLIADYKSAKFAETFNNAKKSYENGADVSQLMSEVADAFNKVNVASNTMQCTDITTDISRYDRYLEKVAHKDDFYFSTGLTELDEKIGGIDKENENMVISARTGIGKTWMLMIIAAAASRQGKTVGIYSGEMSVDKVASRIDTILGNAVVTKFTNTAITKGDALAQNTYKSYLDNLVAKRNANQIGAIKVLTPNDINGPATVDALQAFVEKEHIDILLIDQYSLLEDTSKAKVMHEKVANISKAVKNLQVMKRIPIISVSQNNRTGEKDKDTGQITQDSTQIALSDRIGQDATVLLMLSRDKDKLSGHDKLKINIVKSRDGGDGTELVYEADFDSGRFTYIKSAATPEEAAEMQSRYTVVDTSISDDGELV